MMTINQESFCANQQPQKVEGEGEKGRRGGIQKFTPSPLHLFTSSLALYLTLALCALQASAQEWAQFRGPNGTGISATKNLPVEFGPQKNVLWKTPLPQGHSSPVLGKDRIF